MPLSLLKKAPRLVRVACVATLLASFAPEVSAQRAAGPDRPADFMDPAFHRQRRELLRQKLPARSVAVLFASPVRNRANDVDFKYHQDPDLFYLTGYEEPDAVLVLFKEPQTVGGQSGVTEALYVQPRNPRAEQWTGRRLGTDGTKQQLKLQYVADNKEFAAAKLPWSSFEQVLFLDQPQDARDDTSNPGDVYSLIQTFRQGANFPADYNPSRNEAYAMIRRYSGTPGTANLAPYLTNLTQEQPQLGSDRYLQAYLKASTDDARKQAVAALPTSRFDGAALSTLLDEMREIKTSEEIKHLRQAIRISAVGQQEVMKAMKPNMTEMEVQGLHEFVYRKYGAEFEGYPSIVGAGNNACVLHYTVNDKPRLGNDLVLMDCGAEYHGYTADVTRTIPATGKFTTEQRQIYELVLAAQQAGFEQCKPGSAFRAPDEAARKVVTEGLLKLGIIKDAKEARQYFPHGTSHYLGLDVHDRGTYGPLRAGNVITVEPGIYIPENSPCDKKWWNIGVRIEDDVLVTDKGWENLSKEAPRTVAEIEALMAKSSALDDFKLPELK
ncbi:aminopeptidase P family protein [Hymenobacter sp. HDW8]|uniref:aminopeptidase P family protein n=1 Tax=Hymenobacter sp. HDW8 TaxID=2714932 RepID=UPI00140B4380|nr:aminopeptidase P family protein [Hymenobacter sp. HDW8]QIL76251.1 aminopeptidase P family protein [Hymenobacter sp. HDW8]